MLDQVAAHAGFSLVLAADFISGVVHWWEDRYARLSGGPLQQVAIDNLRHHARGMQQQVLGS